MSNQVIIRKYRRDDIPAMLDIIAMFLNEERIDGYRNHFYGIEFDRDKVYNMLNVELYNNKRFFTNVVTTMDGAILGGLTAKIVPYVFSQELVAKDYLLYFIPSFSNTRALFALVNSYVDWAKDNGVREVQLCSSTGFKEEKFSKLMTKLGFEQFEVGFSRRV